MHIKIKRTLLNILGWGLIIIAPIGLVLPILDSVLLILLGAYILSFNSDWFAEKVKKIQNKNTFFAKVILTLDKFFLKIFGPRRSVSDKNSSNDSSYSDHSDSDNP